MRRGAVVAVAGGAVYILLAAMPALSAGDPPDTPTVRVGVYDNPPKIYRTEEGRAAGLFPDLLRHIAREESWKLHFVPGTWQQGLDRLVAGEIDVMPDVAWSEERARRYDFNDELVLSNWGIVYTRSDRTIESFPDLEGAVVAVMKGSIVTRRFKDLLTAFGVRCTFRQSNDYAGVFADVRDGRARAGVTNRLYGTVYERHYQVVPTTLVFGASRLHFAFPKGAPRSRFLAERIDRQLRRLKNEPNSIYSEAIQRYLTGSRADWETGEFLTGLSTEGGMLTAAEKEWVVNHPRIRVGVDPAYMPFEWIDESGKLCGVAADALKLLNDHCGLSMEVERTRTWLETVEKARAGEIDAVASMGRSPELSSRFLFTRSWLHLPLVVVTRTDFPFVKGMEDLAGARIAVLKGHPATELLRGQFGEEHLIHYDKLPETMKAVSRGGADVVFQPISIVKYFERRRGITNLRVAATSPYSYDVCLGVRKDWPELVGILNKGLERIGETEKELILSRWLNPRIERHVDWARVGLWFALIGIVALSTVGLVLRANRRLAGEVGERRKAEAALKAARDMLEELVHARTEELWNANRRLEEAQRIAHVGNWEWDLTTDRFTGSDECYRIFGMAPGSLIPDLHVYLEYIHPDDRTLVKESFEKAVGGERPFDLEHRIVHAEGETRFVHGRGEQVCDEAGKPVRMIGTLQDITPAKRAQEALQRAHDELEMRVRERTEELAVARDRAEESDRLKSAFLATMSHELRTPLNSIIGFTGIILQGLVGEVNEEQRKQLTMVRDSAHHLLALINDVLDISRIEAGRLELRMERFDVRAAIGKATGVVRPLADKKRLAVDVAVEPSVNGMYGDPRRFEQILINLLGNAVKFTETGSVSLTAGLHGDARLRIRITDTGVGIKAADRERLFKPFQQIDTGTTRRYEGTGLGLSICRKLAVMLGGDIQAHSDGEGKGSTFTLTLPLETEAA